jgi:hypothetical protein
VPMLAPASPLLRLYPPSSKRDLRRAAWAAVARPVVGSLASRRVMSRAPLVHNEGDPRRRQERTPQLHAWYALTRMTRFVPV